jgi:DNA polymerase kappa
MATEITSDEMKNIGIALDTQDDFNENCDDRIIKIRDKAIDLSNRAKSVSIDDLNRAQGVIQKHIESLQKEWPALFGAVPDKLYVHIDLDSFYASVETLKRPEFKDIPLGVGSMLMLSTSNYPARAFGVRAGMPGYMAKKLCPTLVITPCNFDLYNDYSDKVMAVLSAYNPQIEIYGIDEACLVFDDTKLREAYEIYNNNAIVGRIMDEEPLIYDEFGFDALSILVEKIRGAVFRNTRLTVSAGISVCRGLAKYSCGLNKPNGMFMIRDDFDSHISHLLVDKINGIGKATKEMLFRAFNITTVSELRSKINLIYLLYPTKTFLNLFRLSYGLSVFDSTKTKFNAQDKSIGKSMSFKPTTNYKTINDILWVLCISISKKLKYKLKFATIITVTYKYSNFKSYTRRSKTNPVDSEIEIFNLCVEILKETFGGEKENCKFLILDTIRLVGVSVSGLISKEDGLLNIFKEKESVYHIRECPVCFVKFVHEAQMVFESHVNICLNKKMKSVSNEKKKLDWYFKR